MKLLMHGDLSTAQAREDLLLRSVAGLMRGDLKRGEVLRYLRKHVLKMNQADFAELAKVSRRTLTQIESDSYGLNEDSLNRAFAIFGLKLGLVPMSAAHAEDIT